MRSSVQTNAEVEAEIGVSEQAFHLKTEQEEQIDCWNVFDCGRKTSWHRGGETHTKGTGEGGDNGTQVNLIKQEA